MSNLQSQVLRCSAVAILAMYVARFAMAQTAFVPSPMSEPSSMTRLVSNATLTRSKAMHTIATEVMHSTWPHQSAFDTIRIHSVIPISHLQSQLPLLESLRHEISASLGIRVSQEPIDVVVLESQSALESYAKRLLPSVPSRRALYIRHRGPGLVITYWHADWILDARHECTHALLDASGLQLPLWQDEGLAEYFETIDPIPMKHPSHLSAVQSQVRFGQIAELQRLEQFSPQQGMEAKDYRDAWSIIAFLLNASTDTKQLYFEYLQDVQSKRAAGFLSHRAQRMLRTWHVSYGEFYRRSF